MISSNRKVKRAKADEQKVQKSRQMLITGIRIQYTVENKIGTEGKWPPKELIRRLGTGVQMGVGIM